MKIPLMVNVYFRLRKGWKRMNKEAQQQIRQYLLSQNRADGYLNAGGQVDAYYTQFGKVLEAVLSPIKVFWLPKKPLMVKESMGSDTVYGSFFAFLSDDMYFRRPKKISVEIPSQLTTSAVCCILAMQHQIGKTQDTSLVNWLKARQDETGGFHASEVAPVSDLLSTAVALFTLWLIGEHTQPATRFIEAHWLEIGSFSPTILDEYSDVEYLFYGLLALGSE